MSLSDKDGDWALKVETVLESRVHFISEEFGQRLAFRLDGVYRVSHSITLETFVFTTSSL